MIVAIHQPHYLPWLRYMHKMASCDVFVLLDDAQFTKNGWQNRNRIKGPHGPVLLTVPVRSASFKPISEVEITSDSPWREKHWKSLLFNYGKAPFFRQHAEIFEQVFRSRWDRLAALSVFLLEAVARAMGINTPLVRSSSLGIPGSGTTRLIDLCRGLGAGHYLTGAFAAGNHLDAEAFAEAGISLQIQSWDCPRYRQQFPAQGFLPELSVVDLLFNEGPQSLRLLVGEPAVIGRPA